MLHTLGPKLHTDPLLLCKIIRIGKAYFKETLPHCTSGSATSSLKQEILQKVTITSINISPHTSTEFIIRTVRTLMFILINF